MLHSVSSLIPCVELQKKKEDIAKEICNTNSTSTNPGYMIDCNDTLALWQNLLDVESEIERASVHNYSALPVCEPDCENYHLYGMKNTLGLFEAAMDSEEAGMECECLPNCEETVFKTQVNSFEASSRTRPKSSIEAVGINS